MRAMYPSALVSLLLLIAINPSVRPEKADKAERILKLFHDEFVAIEPGKDEKPTSFTMGSKDKDAPESEKPAHVIKMKHPFHIARYEVTQELYELVMGTNPAKWKGPRNSVEMMSWDEANTFCTKVTTLLREKKLLKEDEEIRLPSEAEWEYCCRAGTTTRFSFGDKETDLGTYAWFMANSKGEDPPVGKKKPNPWGLYDMHGYVWEWCSDAWAATHEGAPEDGRPVVKAGAKERVIKGGSFADPANKMTCAAREGKPTNFKSDRVGFRCVKAKIVKEKK